ncbi:MAG: glycosyltransferase family 2 protein, partial [Rubripirellula sp.]|nr:glycosyltransferase family 2 protein [Rubripirellula sp.]
MNHPPFFSIIVPTFNRASLIPRCLQSVLAQNFVDFELIVADDGSTDETDQIVQRFAADDSRVHYVRQENKGAGDARNLGASIAKGRYLIFLDSDDEAKPHWLHSFHNCIASGSRHIACCGMDFRDQNGIRWAVRLPKDMHGQHPLIKGLFQSGSFVIAKPIFDELGGYANGLPANQHSEFRYRLLQKCDSDDLFITFIDEALVLAHDHAGPKIRKNTQAVLDSANYILNTHTQFLKLNRTSYASWLATAGTAAARLHRFPEAQRHFFRAVLVHPTQFRNCIRL